ncbi:hypothetical protein OROHE_005581 [Orobanche hederae]
MGSDFDLNSLEAQQIEVLLLFSLIILYTFQPQQHGLVARSLDLVIILVKNAPIDVLKAAYQVSFVPVVRIVLQSNDHSEMQVISTSS